MSAQELKKHDRLQLIVKQENILIEEKLWAKLNPKKSLIDHMLETGIVAGCLMNGIFRPLVNRLVELTGIDEEILKSQCMILVKRILSFRDEIPRQTRCCEGMS